MGSVLLLLGLLVPGLDSPAQDLTGGDEVVLIDGDRTPELIPQWTLWEHTFRLFGRGAKLLPATLLRHLTAAESSGIFAAADAHLKREAELQEYAVRVRLLVAREPLHVRQERLRQAHLEYRRGILDARDRLLDGLRPAAQSALTNFVESRKSAVRLSLPKSELTWFHLPE